MTSVSIEAPSLRLPQALFLPCRVVSQPPIYCPLVLEAVLPLSLLRVLTI